VPFVMTSRAMLRRHLVLLLAIAGGSITGTEPPRALLPAPGGQPASAQSRFDLLVRNGRIFDGSGNPWFRGDVGIVDGRMAAVGNLPAPTATRSVDAGGRFVAPGFIDIHSHSDRGLGNTGSRGSRCTRTSIPTTRREAMDPRSSFRCGRWRLQEPMSVDNSENPAAALATSRQTCRRGSRTRLMLRRSGRTSSTRSRGGVVRRASSCTTSRTGNTWKGAGRREVHEGAAGKSAVAGTVKRPCDRVGAIARGRRRPQPYFVPAGGCVCQTMLMIFHVPLNLASCMWSMPHDARTLAVAV
jgi:hypothetical protein